MLSVSAMMEQHRVSAEMATGSRNLPKCYGIAKNFFTKAKAADPSTATPPYPLIFGKSLSCIKPHGKPFPIPWHAADDAVCHEVELGVIMNSKKATEVSHWTDRVAGWVLLIDYTDKVQLGKAVKGKTPFFLSKCQDNFLSLSDLIPKEAIVDPYAVELTLKINGEVRHRDLTANMNFKIEDQIAHIENEGNSQLGEGDLLMTGTPEGISPVMPGDLLEATLMYEGKVLATITEKVVKEVKPF